MSKHTNRLINETSPYLLQHAHNPVDWYPWGKEAISKAKEENKPILVSIGYAACHWCHVMERESFENEEIAALMNKYFINIKVDREERPDIDHIYMDAVQAMTGSGGWPLNVFLTPDCKPFYGGTYFPPTRVYNRASWPEILTRVHEAFTTNKDGIETQAENLTAHLKKANSFGQGGHMPGNTILEDKTFDLVTENLLKSADTEWGGFGQAPKFPQVYSIIFLLRHFHHTKHQQSLSQALLSLDKMIYGGIYDQIGGGFARYSTDEKWFAPHFEKMLYDNALLIMALSEAYQLTQIPLYADTIYQTMEFIQREMLSPEGGFYSALDADSEGVEGKFYTWQKEEIEEVLGDQSDLFCEYFNIAEGGNWEHTNILWVQKPLEEFSDEKGISPEEFKKMIAEAKMKLLSRRNLRIRPQLDDKVLLSWNALMVTACCKAYAATGVEAYKDLAEKNISFLQNAFQLKDEKTWMHVYKEAKAKYPAFLDDYAFLAEALIHLQEVTGNHKYLELAKEIVELVKTGFEDKETGFFFFTEEGQEDVIIRKKEVIDGATPSGNSTMAFNLFYLGRVFDLPGWQSQAIKMLAAIGNPVIQYPTSFAKWATQIRLFAGQLKEIAIVGKEASEYLEEVLKLYLPERVIQSALFETADYPLLAGKNPGDETSIYVCSNYSCSKPINSIPEFKALLN